MSLTMRAILVVFVLADLMEPRVFTVRIMPVSALRWGIERIKNTGAVRREVNYPALKDGACNYVTDTLQLAG